MSLTVSYRMDEDDLVKLMDYYGPTGLNIPAGANRGRLLGAIVHGHVKDLITAGKVPDGPLDLAYLEKRLRDLLYKRSHSGQLHLSTKRLQAEQAKVMAEDELNEDIEKILEMD